MLSRFWMSRSFALALASLSLSLSDASCARRRPRAVEDSTEADVPVARALKTEDLVVGSGAAAAIGALISIHYTGWLNGAKFDTSLNREPLRFRLGKGEVLRGWDVGIVGMKVGGKRRLTIPPALAYGHNGSAGGVIPPDSVLIFDIELVSVT